jgi:hypothetical protein
VEPWQEPGFVLYFFHEITPANIQYWLDNGIRVVMTDRMVAGAKTEVIEYLNTGLNHYFLALPDESGAIERGDAGLRRPPWSVTAKDWTPVVQCWRVDSRLRPEPVSRIAPLRTFLGDPTVCAPADNDPHWEQAAQPLPEIEFDQRLAC